MINKFDTDKEFCVYVHTNKTNGKRYVGTTSQDPEKRWQNGRGYTERQPHMYNAIKKWGWDNFTHEILITGVSAEHADSLERMLIKAWKLQDRKYGYNAQSGGLTSSTLSEEIRTKISEALTGRSFSEEHRQHLSEARKSNSLSDKQQEHLEKFKKYWVGKEFTEEHKKNLSKSLTGKTRSEEQKQNISKAKKGKLQSEAQKIAFAAVCQSNVGRKHSEESKAKISAGNKGKKVSQEAREKMSKAHKGKRHGGRDLIRVAQYDLHTGNFIQEWECIMDASRATGIDNSYIAKCAKGKCKQAGGFAWKII